MQLIIIFQNIVEAGVTAIPPSAFYSPETRHLAGNTLRFAYCKSNDTILEAHEKLATFEYEEMI